MRKFFYRPSRQFWDCDRWSLICYVILALWAVNISLANSLQSHDQSLSTVCTGNNIHYRYDPTQQLMLQCWFINAPILISLYYIIHPWLASGNLFIWERIRLNRVQLGGRMGTDIVIIILHCSWYTCVCHWILPSRFPLTTKYLSDSDLEFLIPQYMQYKCNLHSNK